VIKLILRRDGIVLFTYTVLAVVFTYSSVFHLHLLYVCSLRWSLHNGT
jgi:hypothetical protein